MDFLGLMSDQLKLVVGFDIGTAYSSVSFALAPINGSQSQANNARGVSTQESMPVSFNGRYQVSSQLAWWSEVSNWTWGDHVDVLVDESRLDESDRIQMLKMCLEGSSRTQRIRDKLHILISRLPHAAKEQLMTPTAPEAGDLIGMYLKLLWTETRTQIMGHYAKSNAGNIFDYCPVESWISVPNLWSPQINAIMVAAADWAGIPDIHLVHEPEAAAALCLLEQYEHALRYGQLAAASMQGIHAGTFDSILVLDAGCGTVVRLSKLYSMATDPLSVVTPTYIKQLKDLMTYLIEARSPNLLMREGVRGTAGLDGSGLLNQHFLDLLEPLVESSLPTASLERQNPAPSEVKTAIMTAAVKSFEEKKKQFGSNSEKAAGKPMRIRVPGLQRKLRTSKSSLSSDHIEIPREDIIGLFDKIVVEVISMLRQQIMAFNKRYRHQKIDCIIFVGGLSGSQYVFDKLEETFLGHGAIMGYEISILRPYQDSATIISKGSVLRALHHPVSDRILAQSYGFQQDEEYVPWVHGKAESVRDFHDGCDVVERRIHWLCRVGDAIKRDNPTILRMRGWRGVEPDGHAHLEEPLFASYTEVQDHVDAHSNGIDEVGRIELDLSHIDRSGFRKGVSIDTQDDYVRLDYEIKLIFDGMQLSYELIIPTNGSWWKCDPNSEFSDEHWGPQPYRETNVVRSIAAAFDVSGYQVRSGPQRVKNIATTREGKKTTAKATARRTGKAGPLKNNSTGNPRTLRERRSAPAGAYPSLEIGQTHEETSLEPRRRSCQRCRYDRKTCKGEAAGRACTRCWTSGHECIER